MILATSRRSLRALATGACIALAAPLSHAAVSSVDLSSYTLAGTFFLPAVTASEASAVTYDWDRNSLFVLGDEGEALVEVDFTGNQLSVMTLSGFNDTEGVTYIGNGEFVITEERMRDAFKLSYVAGGSVARGTLASADLGSDVGNVGIEGISYDPRDGSFVTVKENVPQEVNVNTITFGTPGSATTTSLFDPALLNFVDVSDVQVLATVPGLAGTAEADNLLIYSQESRRLVETDRNGNVLSEFDFFLLADQAEGVTIDFDGNIYVVDENGSLPRLFVLAPTPVPLPAAAWLLAPALAGLWTRRRRG
ncbi:MAG: SdiA-regulated domain-containing protein [Gammaproteobacteria bacterium]